MYDMKMLINRLDLLFYKLLLNTLL